MQISVASSITRVRPHIFTWIHTLRLLATDEQSTESLLDEFDNMSKGGLQAKLTKKERQAVSTCMFAMERATLDTLLSYSSRRGMTKKTAFSLDGLSSHMLRLGATVPECTPKYTELFTTIADSVQLVIERMIQDLSRRGARLRWVSLELVGGRKCEGQF